MSQPKTDDREDPTRQLETERSKLLDRLVQSAELPMAILGFVWLLLLVIELVAGLNPILQALGTAIWGLFVVAFLVEFVVAPKKRAYLRANWLTALSLAAPALRALRIVRLARVLRTTRAARGLGLLRIVSSVNRGMGALGATMGRRGFGYVVALTIVVTLTGAAGMYAFERQSPDAGPLETYGGALWWTAMIVTTMGSEYWPETAAGRVLCLLLALYAFAVFGYVTATLASFFVGRDAEDKEGELAGAGDVRALHAEIVRLRTEIAGLRSVGLSPPDQRPPRTAE